MGFTRAADKINVALSDDLGGNAEAAITAIGKMTDIFNLQEEFGIEKAMLKVGSAINELGMASTANEGYIVDFSKRLAGIAPNADISIDKVLGMAATLDKYGQQAETASTAIGQTIMAMFKRTETFAGIAKMPLEEFAELLDKDVNEALLRVLEGMNDGNGLSSVVAAMDEMHLNGQRASTILGTLSKNVNELRAQQQLANQAFEEGISLDNEFETKNTSLTAQMEKRKKAILENVVAMGQELMPISKLAISAAEKGAGWLLQLLKLGMQLKGVIITLAAVYAAYNISVKTANTIAKLKLFWSKANRAAMEEEVIALKANTTAVSELNKKDLLLMATKNLLAGNIKVAGTALKMFGKAVSASLGPIGWIVLGIQAIIGVIALLRKKSGEATKALRELNKQTKDTASGYVEAKTKIDEERRSLENLLESVKKANLGSKERANAIKRINDKYGDYLPNLLTEKSSNEEIETALRNVNTQLEKKILLQAKENELQDVLKHKTDTVKAALESYQILFEKINGRKMNVAEITSMTDILSRTYDNVQKDHSDLNYREYDKDSFKTSGRNFRKERRAIGITPNSNSQKRLLWNINEEFQEAIRNGKKLKAVVDGLYGTTDNGTNASSGNSVNDASADSDSTAFSSGGSDNKWSLEKDEKHMQQVLALKDKYAKKEIASEEEYKRQMLELEIKSLEERIASNKESGEELLKLKNQLADKRIALEEHVTKEAEKKAKEEERTAKESAAFIEEVNKDKVAAENRRYQEDLTKYKGNTAALEAAERKHLANLRKIMLEDISERESDAKRDRDLAIATAQNRHTAELASFHGTRSELKALKQQQANELAQIDLDYVSKMKDILDDIINIDTGEVTIAFEGISDAELDAVKLKLQEIIALKNQVENTSSASSGGTSDSANIGGKHRKDTGGELFNLDINQWETMFDPATAGADRLKLAVQAVGAAAGEAMNLASMWADRQTAIENKQLKAYEKANDEKKKVLKERLEAGLMTEAHYNAEVERLDAEHDAYEEELRLKQAKRDKQMQLTQAIINTALSITSALAAPFPLSIVAAALAAATGAAQIALIASTPITAGAEDGGFGGEVIRAQDGKKFKSRLSPDKRGFISSPTLLVSENGQEYVIPKEGLENPTLLPFINTMETARKNGQLRNLNFEAIYPVATGRASGGFAAGNSHYETTSSIQQLDPELKELISKLLDRLNRPITAEVSLFGKKGIIEKQEEYQRYKNKGRL